MNTDERYTKVNPSIAPDDQAGMVFGESIEGPKTKVNPNTNTNESTSTGSETKVNPASSQSNTTGNAYHGTRINPNTNQDVFSSNTNVLSVGEIFADKYRIESVLDGSGGEAILYVCSLVNCARDTLLDETKQYCLKIYTRSDRIQQSVRSILQKIDHSNVAKIVDWGECNNKFYELLELYNGETLASYIKKNLIKEEDIDSYVRQMSEALNELHKNNIIHQDVKPSNFMVMAPFYSGEEKKLKLFDFGISGLIGDMDGRTHVTQIGKTHIYSAPEVLLSQYCWPASDYYSMGITLIELLTGKTPYENYDDSNLMRKISDMQKINIPILLQFSDRTQALIVGLLQFERQDRCEYEEIKQWLSGHYPEPFWIKWRNWKEQMEGHSKPVFAFLGKEYAIPSEVPSLVTQMAFNWNEGIAEISEDRDTKGQFKRLLYELDKVLKQDTSGFSTEELNSLWNLEKVCNKTNLENIDPHFFYLQKLFNLFPGFKHFAWRGYVAEDPKSLGMDILKALWNEEEQKELPTYTFVSDFPFEGTNNSNGLNTLKYAALKHLFENHIVSWYLNAIQDRSYAAIVKYENAIVSCAMKNDNPDYYYYKIGYLLSGSSAVTIAGKTYEDRDSFVSYLNTIIDECNSSGDLSKFQGFIHLIYNNKSEPPGIRMPDRMAAKNEPSLKIGFLVWLESQGLKAALDDLLRGLGVMYAI